MEAVVDQPLGDVVDGDAGAVLEGPRVEDALMRDPTLAALVEHVEGAFEPLGDVVGVQDRDLGRLRQPLAAHHQDIGPGDRQDAGRAVGRGRDRAFRAAGFGMAGQEGRQMRLDPDRAHARAAAAVRDAEGLVQVQVADIAADLAGLGEADHRVQVGAVDIDLPAVFVGDLADLAHGFLEDAVGRGIGDHAGGQPVARRFGLGAEIVDVDVAAARRISPRPRPCRTSAPRPGWCRAPRPGSGRRGGRSSPRER